MANLQVIMEDLKLLGIAYDHLSHTSDFFDTLLDKCEQLIREGKLYCDDTDPETMKKEREERTESKNRGNSTHSCLYFYFFLYGVFLNCNVLFHCFLSSFRGV